MEDITYNGPVYKGPVTSNMELITPELAEKWLKNNFNNRRPSKKAINKYAQDMLNDKWEGENGETVSFFQSKKLKNGQHRLAAIVESKKAEWTLVVRGIPDEYTICDRGRGRTINDRMVFEGYSADVRSNTVTGAVRFLLGVYRQAEVASDDQILDFIDKHESEIAMAYSACSKNSESPKCKKAPVVAAALIASCCGINDDVIERFCYVANTGYSKGPAESAAITYAKMLDAYSANLKTSDRADAFRYALMAIEDFSSGRRIERKYARIRESKLEKEGGKILFGIN